MNWRFTAKSFSENYKAFGNKVQSPMHYAALLSAL